MINIYVGHNVKKLTQALTRLPLLLLYDLDIIADKYNQHLATKNLLSADVSKKCFVEIKQKIIDSGMPITDTFYEYVNTKGVFYSFIVINEAVIIVHS